MRLLRGKFDIFLCETLEGSMRVLSETNIPKILKGTLSPSAPPKKGTQETLFWWFQVELPNLHEYACLGSTWCKQIQTLG